MGEAHQTRVGHMFQATIPEYRYFRGSLPTFSRCFIKAREDGLTRADVAENCGVPMWRCDVLPEEAVKDYMQRAEAMTPPYVKFDKTEALQLLHNNNYIVDDALLALAVNMQQQNFYNEIHFTGASAFPYLSN